MQKLYGAIVLQSWGPKFHPKKGSMLAFLANQTLLIKSLTKLYQSAPLS